MPECQFLFGCNRINCDRIKYYRKDIAQTDDAMSFENDFI